MAPPILTPAEVESRKARRREQLIGEAMDTARDGITFLHWVTLSEEGMRMRLIKALEPLLKRAEEGELWSS
ncbi:MAG: hypothetical protein ACXVXO_01305 [Mycobacteriaceae bacterium]